MSLRTIKDPKTFRGKIVVKLTPLVPNANFALNLEKGIFNATALKINEECISQCVCVFESNNLD